MLRMPTHAGDADPADVSVEDGIQVLAGTNVTVTLTSAEALLMSSVMADDFEVVNAEIEAQTATHLALPESIPRSTL